MQEELDRKNQVVRQEIETLINRIHNLGINGEPHEKAFKDVKSDTDLKQNLESLKIIKNELQQLVNQQVQVLQNSLQELINRAQEMLETMHPTMPEYSMLKEVLDRQEQQKEETLVSYLEELDLAIEVSIDAGINTISHFQQKVTENSDYAFENTEEIDRVGHGIAGHC